MKIFLISGKRAVGKDTFTKLFKNIISKKYPTKNIILTALADAPKKLFCNIYKLDYNKFMNDRSYKEMYREAFIKFAENEKNKDKYIWCKKAMKDIVNYNNIIIISDLRYPVEYEFFLSCYKRYIITIRINSLDNVRKKRGWVFNKKIDNHLSETGLDKLFYNHVLYNNYDNVADFYKNIIKLNII